MDNLRIEVFRMTGSEFEDICNISKIEKQDLFDIFGVSKGTLYNYFKLKDKPVPAHRLEAIIDAHPILSEAKNKVIKGKSMEVAAPKSEAPEIVKLLADTIQVMREVLAKGEKKDEIIEKAMTSLTDNNNRLGRLVDIGIDSGAIKWQKTA